MDLKLLKKEDNKLSFILKGTNYAFVNTLRRIFTTEVPTLAVKNVTIVKNSSALFDEVIAHRLGLIPLKTDLTAYNLTENCTCKGKGCPKCQVSLVLKAEGPLTVYASDLKSQDPKVKPVYGKMPIVKLLKGQELEFEALVTLGNAKDHAKYSSCHVYYRGIHDVSVDSDNKAKQCVKACEGLLDGDSKKLVVKDLLRWNERYEEICEEIGAEIKNSEKDFLFHVESWGQLEPLEILNHGSDILDTKLDEFITLLNKSK